MMGPKDIFNLKEQFSKAKKYFTINPLEQNIQIDPVLKENLQNRGYSSSEINTMFQNNISQEVQQRFPEFAVSPPSAEDIALRQKKVKDSLPEGYEHIPNEGLMENYTRITEPDEEGKVYGIPKKETQKEKNKIPKTETSDGIPENSKRGRATYYNLTPGQTDDTPTVGGFGKKIEFGDVAIGNREEYFRARDKFQKEGKDVFIKIPELENVETPHGKGVFRVRDTMNKRYSGKNRIDIAIPEDKKELENVIGSRPASYYYLD